MFVIRRKYPNIPSYQLPLNDIMTDLHILFLESLTSSITQSYQKDSLDGFNERLWECGCSEEKTLRIENDNPDRRKGLFDRICIYELSKHADYMEWRMRPENDY